MANPAGGWLGVVPGARLGTKPGVSAASGGWGACADTELQGLAMLGRWPGRVVVQKSPGVVASAGSRGG